MGESGVQNEAKTLDTGHDVGNGFRQKLPLLKNDKSTKQ